MENWLIYALVRRVCDPLPPTAEEASIQLKYYICMLAAGFTFVQTKSQTPFVYYLLFDKIKGF